MRKKKIIVIVYYRLHMKNQKMLIIIVHLLVQKILMILMNDLLQQIISHLQELQRNLELPIHYLQIV
ncbi:hypothetical protein GLOIN_2v1636821 [Rhizophagus irregularis DAOM 181602=DAOM 197198]|uniref:Uncharacterized protein n=1 Tax=Rhizophagus irregularis (strain DAOM 181602 / DAOM 197198 / MUCL 43194) TaxID=747089 RepID=A0A2P4PSU4_RHIID|nr:hypothetical protein GLOIN_2v1636821 [Rhizophagus irregularis DAOM 181602=DAOM 197198]POG68449.1 hypothetical protein GLOIN_2v1636821 [Rhizophagus irregularis DAOM 181602=DAOM 197198]|eukprot:XP_025175315.1 hypothetical protein GLOIN_2v1636821 [Rhizophagus irregularis DAOM 181602=DAOM 197198]